MTGNYDASFYLGGGMFMAGTLFHLVLHLPCVKRGNLPSTDKEMNFDAPNDTNEVKTGDEPVAV